MTQSVILHFTQSVQHRTIHVNFVVRICFFLSFDRKMNSTEQKTLKRTQPLNFMLINTTLRSNVPLFCFTAETVLKPPKCPQVHQRLCSSHVTEIIQH